MSWCPWRWLASDEGGLQGPATRHLTSRVTARSMREPREGVSSAVLHRMHSLAFVLRAGLRVVVSCARVSR